MAAPGASESPSNDLLVLLRRNWHYVALVAVVLWLLYRVRGILGPFVVGIVLAYITDPFLDRLEARGWSRDRAIAFVLALGFVAFLLLSAVVLPMVAIQANSLVRTVATNLERFDGLVATMPGLAKGEVGGESASESATESAPAEPTEPVAAVAPESTVAPESAESAESAGSTESAAAIVPPVPPVEDIAARRERLAEEWSTWYAEHLPQVPEWARSSLPKPDLGDPSGAIAQYRGKLTEWGRQVLGTVASFLLGSLGGLFKYVFTPFVTFYFMREIDPMRRRMASWVPERYHDRVRAALADTNRMLASYFRGQLTLMVLVFATCLVTMLIVKAFIGIDNILLVAAVDGLFYAVPIAGAWIASLVAGVVGYVSADGNPWVGAIVMVAAIQVVNFVFDQIVTPKIAGDKVGLHPLVVIFAVLAGAALLGFVGMLVAVPVAAMIRILLVRFMPEVLRELKPPEPAGTTELPPDDAPA